MEVGVGSWLRYEGVLTTSSETVPSNNLNASFHPSSSSSSSSDDQSVCRSSSIASMIDVPLLNFLTTIILPNTNLNPPALTS